jgi:lipoprotein-releasing system ATP-binding protein
MLVAEDIHKSYGDLDVLKGITLQVKSKEIISIVGASGAGKSTLLHILGTLDKPDSGKLILDDQILENMNGNQLARFRNTHIGFIFQFHNLLQEFTALENICIPGFIKSDAKQEVEQRALDLMKILGILERKDHKPSELSGGEQQRTAVARALINSPSIVFADEPSGNLDSQNAGELHHLFFKLREELGHTFVIVTHNAALAEMADRKLTIVDGQITSS